MKNTKYTICKTDKGFKDIKSLVTCRNEDTATKVVKGLKKNVSPTYFIIES